MIRLRLRRHSSMCFRFAGSRLAMTMLAVAPQRIAVLSFDLRCATPVPSILTGRSDRHPFNRFPNQAFNALWQHTASRAIPIASDAPPRPVSRAFLGGLRTLRQEKSREGG